MTRRVSHLLIGALLFGLPAWAGGPPQKGKPNGPLCEALVKGLAAPMSLEASRARRRVREMEQTAVSLGLVEEANPYQLALQHQRLLITHSEALWMLASEFCTAFFGDDSLRIQLTWSPAGSVESVVNTLEQQASLFPDKWVVLHLSLDPRLQPSEREMNAMIRAWGRLRRNHPQAVLVVIARDPGAFATLRTNGPHPFDEAVLPNETGRRAIYSTHP